MTPQPHLVCPRPARRRPDGFALLITIVLVAFLVLVLVTLASLTRVETTVASNSRHVSEARDNALVALNVAIGQLQRFAGPDRRVTATAALGDASDNGLPVAVDGTRAWTGVWGNSASPDAAGSSPVFLNWLVSGNESAAFQVGDDGSVSSVSTNPAHTPSQSVAGLSGATALSEGIRVNGADARLLVGAGTVGDSAAGIGEAGYVAAPLTDISVDSSLVPGLGAGGGPTTVGRYAWWVGDEGVKARVNLVESEAAISETVDADRRLRYRAPARAGIELMADIPAALADADLGASGTSALRADLRKIVAPRQLALASGGAAFPTAFRQGRFHDYSTGSRGVLADSLAGGLRLDLTAAFASGTDRTDAPTGPIWQLDPNDDYLKGPDWQLLRSYYQLPASAGATGTGSALALSPRPYVDGVTDATKPASQGVFPVVASWQMYVEGRVTGLSTSGCGLELRYYPAVVLWNPYNVTLRDHAYRLTYSINGGDVTFMRVSARNAATTYSQVPAAVSADAQLNSPWRDGLNVTVQSGDMEPGVAYVYTLNADIYYTVDNFTRYTLRRGWNSGGSRAIVVGGNSFSLTGGDNSKYMVSLWRGTNSSGGPNNFPSWVSQTQTVPSAPIGAGQTEPVVRDDKLVLATSSGDVLQTVTSNNNYDDAFKLRWARDVLLYRGLDGYSGTQSVGYTGHRWALRTTAASTLSPSTYKNRPTRWLAGYNPRAPYAARTPFEMQNTNLGDGYYHTNPSYNFALDNGASGFGAGSFDPINADAAIPCDPDTGRAFVGMSQVTWDGAGESVVTLFNIPRSEHPVVSLGEFQHAQLYRENGVPFAANASPAYAVGNSLVDPRATLDAPWRAWTDINIGNNGFKTYQPSARVFDHSYLLNRALWDGYFLSTVPAAAASTAVEFPLPNPRLVLHDRDTTTPDADLRDAQKSAATLLVDGAFNVNSVSREAWRAFLGGLNNVPLGSNRRASESPYPRLAYPIDDSLVLDPGSTTDAGMLAEAYAGQRFLTEDEIDDLADAMVTQVRRRGPFLSIADFVNRSLTAGSVSGVDNRLRGAIAQAIEDAGLNGSAFASGEQVLLPGKGTGSTAMVEAIDQGPTAANVPGWITQADLLQPLGPSLAARSDTFTIRAYGETINPLRAASEPDRIQARAWCEAVVQRVPEYVSDANAPWDAVADLTQENRDLGRRFRVVSFRWLSPEEI